MNATYENQTHLERAESYYRAIIAKDFDKMAGYLHDDVHFIGPLAEMRGKNSVFTAEKHFAETLQDIQIRSKFSSGNQIMFAYDRVAPECIGKSRVAVLMEFTDGLISTIELFYDARSF